MSLVYTAPPTGTQAGPAIGLRNKIYLGGRSDAKSLEKLEKWKVSHILNVTPAKDTSIQAGVPNFFESTGKFVYKRIAVYDLASAASELESHAKEIIQFIHKALFHGSVLVHCRQGISRSTTAVLFYLMSKANLGLQEAMASIRRRRPYSQPNPAFWKVLERYESKHTPPSKTEPPDEPTKRKSVGPARPVLPPAKKIRGPTLGPSADDSSRQQQDDTGLPNISETTGEPKEMKPVKGPMRPPS